MSSDAPQCRPAWLHLAWWYHHDARAKKWLVALSRGARPWPEHERTRAIMLLCHAIGWPCLLTPLLTRWLYPWLPQPDAVLFYLWGATSLSGALLATLKQQERAVALSEDPGLAPNGAQFQGNCGDRC